MKDQEGRTDRLQQTLQDIQVRESALELAVDVFHVTSRFPHSEVFGLTSQMRRAAYSIGSNIAEGWGRGNVGDFARFLDIAAGSTAELSTQMEIAGRVGLGEPEDVQRICNACEVLHRRIRAFAKTLRASKNKPS